MLFLVTFFFRDGVSLSRFIVVKCGSSDEHPLFQKRVFQCLFDWDLLYKHFDPLRGLALFPVLSSAGVAPLPPCFHKLLSETVTTFAVDVPSRRWRHLPVVRAVQYESPPLLLLAVWRKLPRDVYLFSKLKLRTVVFSQRRMISFLFCLAVLPTCYLLHDSRLLGLTLRSSAPVCCCHRVCWARGRLAFAQEAVRCPPSFLLDWICM